MKKKNLKPMIVSALLATTFGATAAGTSFALFTDSAETSINVTAGKVDVATALTIEAVSSLNSTDVGNTVHESKLSANLSQGGEVTIENGVAKVDRMIPGDKVVLKMVNTNASNVAIKTRITKSVSSYVFSGELKVADTSEKKLGDKLTVKFYSDSALTTEVTNYEKWSNPIAPSNDPLATYYIVVEFPDGDNGAIKFGAANADNVYQNKAADFAFAIEAVQGNTYIPNTQYDFADSYVEGEGASAHYVHKVSSKAEFKNILTHIAANAGAKDENNVPLADKNTVYLLSDDINFGGVSLYSTVEEFDAADVKFTGIFDGGNHTLDNVVINAYNKERAGLFRDALNAEFKNFTLSRVTTANENGKIALISSGCGESEGLSDDASYLKFENITIDNTCSVVGGGSSTAAFLALGRSLYTLSFVNCVNYASVLNTASHSTAAFVAGATSIRGGDQHELSPKGTVTFDNCINYGAVTSQSSSNGGLVGSLIGQGHGQGKYVLKNVSNYGNITDVSGYKVSPFICFNTGNIDLEKFEITNLRNSGSIKKADHNYGGTTGTVIYDPQSLGLTEYTNATNPVLTGDGTSQTYKNFIDNYVIASDVVTLSVQGTGTQLTNKQFTINGTDALEDITKVVFHQSVNVMNISYDTNTGHASNSGVHDVSLEEIVVSSLGSSYSLPRLMYIGNTYTNKGEPLVTYTGEETHGDTFVYKFDKFLVDSNNTWPMGYHKLDDGSAYFIHDNTNVSSGVYYLTHDLPSCVYYEVNFYNSQNKLKATTGLVADFWVPSGSGMLNLREIPVGVNLL